MKPENDSYAKLSEAYFQRYGQRIPSEVMEIILTEFFDIMLERMARNKVVKDHARAIRFAPKWFLKNNEQVKEGSDLTNPKDELSVLTMDLTGASTHKSMFLNGKVTFSLERRQFEYLYEALYGKKNYFKKYWLK